MTKNCITLLLLLVLAWSPIIAEIDPEEILRQLPPPEVNYTLPEIRTVKQPVALPDYSTAEHYGKPATSKREFERSLKSVKSLLETQAVTSTIKLIGNLANKQQKSMSPADRAASGSQPGAKGPNPVQSAQTAQSDAKPQTASTERAVKPPPVALKPAVPPPTGNLMAAYKTLRQNPALLEFEQSLSRDRQLAVDTFEVALQLAANPPKTESNDSESAIDESEEEEKAPAGTHDAVLATAMGLYKKQDWKGLKDLFSENQEAGETKDGLKYQIEAEAKEAKPNYMQIRRYSDQLVKIDEQDPMGNYGLALAYYNAKKPNTAKAQEHLAVALKAKTPPEGASSLYWSMTFKKFMIPLLIVIAALIGGISKVIKKKKAAALDILDQPADQIKPEAETKQPGKLMQKLTPLIDKLKGIMSRFKKKPATTADAQKAPEKAGKASAAKESGGTEETAAAEEESGEEEEEEENELEEEDAEALKEDGGEEESESDEEDESEEEADEDGEAEEEEETTEA